MGAESDFAALLPLDVADAAEAVLGIAAQSVVDPYPSYVNRVYGVRADDGTRCILKFYRPGRWTEEALRAEHSFCAEAAADGLPVVPPLTDAEGETLHTLVAETEEGQERTYRFAVYPFVRGRGWEPECDDDWLGLGETIARLHRVGRRFDAPSRPQLTPAAWAKPALAYLMDRRLIHPEAASDFADLCGETLDSLEPSFEGIPMLRLHGDLHRGNVLRGEKGPLLIDFDDMAVGPAVQDFWLFLPGRRNDAREEAALLVEGYERVTPFDWSELNLIEGLRFMRMLSYLAWQARQRDDAGFLRAFPDWGSRTFWLKELEDFRDQSRMLGEEA